MAYNTCTRKNLTSSQQDACSIIASLSTSCKNDNDIVLSSCYKVATSLVYY